MKYLGLLTAVIYNSWLLGYWFNPSVARHGLMSTLEATHQPYRWLFVAGDSLCCLLVLLIVWLYFKNSQPLKRSDKLLLVGLIVFAILTMASAVIPLNCGHNILSCGYGASLSFSWHDLLGAGAALGLFFAMLFALENFKPQPQLRQANLILLLLWSAIGLCYLLIALNNGSVNSLLHNFVTATQQVFIGLSGLSVWLICYGLSKERELDATH